MFIRVMAATAASLMLVSSLHAQFVEWNQPWDNSLNSLNYLGLIDGGELGYHTLYLPHQEAIESQRQLQSQLWGIEADLRRTELDGNYQRIYPSTPSQIPPILTPGLPNYTNPFAPPTPTPKRASRFGDYQHYYPGLNQLNPWGP